MRRIFWVFITVIFVLVSFFIMINIHEIGHTAIARLAGDHEAMYYLYRASPEGLCIGCNVFNDSKLSLLGNAFVLLGGIIFTQSMALVLLLWRWAGIRPKWLRRLNAVLVAAFLIDLPFQVFQGVVVDIEIHHSMTGIDLAAFIWIFSGATGFPWIGMKIILIAVTMLYAAGIVWLIRLISRRAVLPPAS